MHARTVNFDLDTVDYFGGRWYMDNDETPGQRDMDTPFPWPMATHTI